MPPTPQLQPRRQKPVKQTIINALPPTAVAQQQQYQPQQQQHLHLPPPPPKTHQQHQQPQNVFICAPSWSQQQSSIQAMLQASSRQPPLPRPQVCCRWCQSTNPDGDCRDGFCSSVWNKENLMRPIHIWMTSLWALGPRFSKRAKRSIPPPTPTPTAANIMHMESVVFHDDVTHMQ